MYAWYLQRSEEDVDHLELELPVVVGHHAGAGNLFCKTKDSVVKL